MAKYTFDIRLNKIVPHTATITVEADNVADAIQQVRRSEADGATWEPEGNGYWGDHLQVGGLKREGLEDDTFQSAEGEYLDDLGLAWFKRHEAKALKVAA